MSTKFDLQLCQKFTACQEALDNSAQLQKTVHHLLCHLEKSYFLSHQLDSYLYRKFPQIDSQMLADARQEAFVDFWRKLHQFFQWLENHNINSDSPQLPQTCIAYFKSIAFRRTVDLLRRDKGHLSLDVTLGFDTGMTYLDFCPDLSIDLWAQLIRNEEKAFISMIIADPDGQFSKIRSRKYPHCTLSRIVQEITAGGTFHEIGDRLQMPIGTLTAFWYRHAQVA